MFRNTLLVGCLVGEILVATAVGQRPAYALTTNAHANWAFSDAPGTTFSGAAAGGAWTVGQNSASVQGVPGACVPAAAVGGGYAANAVGAQVCSITGADPFTGATTTATGQSSISVGAATILSGLWPFTMSTLGTTVVRSGLGAPFGDAKGTVIDPQSVSSPGIYGFTVSIGPESSIFTDDPGGYAQALLTLTGPGVAGPLASIDLATIGISGLDATVSFAENPLLTFFDPVTLAPITAAQVEALLEGLSSLNSLTGLTSQLPLFFYLLDLTGGLPANAAFGADLSARAVAVPEPGTCALLGTALIGLLGYARKIRNKSA